MKAYLPTKPSSNVYRVTHTNLENVYEAKEGDLIVGMKGGTYVYQGVPIEHMVELLRAESAGKYLNGVIKPNYGYRTASDEEASALAMAEPAQMTDAEHAHLFPNSDEARDLSLLHTIELTDLKVGDKLITPPVVNWSHPVDIKFLDPEVKVKYAKVGDAAFDLMASIDKAVTIQPGQHAMIATGIAMKLSPGLAGLVMPRSGLAAKLRVSVVNSPGLIDSGYIGEIKVLVENRGDMAFEVKPYDRIAQYMIVPAITPIFRVVTDLEQTERGDTGFGSSGVAKDGDVVV